MSEELYICNPFKNTECNKTGCYWLNQTIRSSIIDAIISGMSQTNSNELCACTTDARFAFDNNSNEEQKIFYGLLYGDRKILKELREKCNEVNNERHEESEHDE